MRKIAVITARSGSKGIKDKNIRLLNGKPLMWYSIRAALDSGLFDTVMVSTDSAEYAKIARECGAEVPFLRDAANSGDRASSWDTVKEVLDKYKANGEVFDVVCLLQPTSPLRDASDILGAWDEFIEKKADAVVSVCELEYSMNYVNRLPEDKSLVGFLHSDSYSRQQHEPYYRFNGAVYFTKVDTLFAYNSIFDANCFAYVMQREHSVDIDEELDLLICESIMNRNTVR